MGLKELLTNLESGNNIAEALDNYPLHKNPVGTGPGFANYGNSYTPVFEGQFRQKSFRFGEGTAFDRPGASFSQQPYIYNKAVSGSGLAGDLQAGIESVSDAVGQFGDKLGDVTDGYTDGFIRGGLGTALKRSADDMLRVGKWMTDGPKGPTWILKQVGLQRSNPRLQEFPQGEKSDPEDNLFKKAVTGIGNFLGSAEAALGRNRVYNLGINTLAQTLTNAFGYHTNRAGLLPIGRPNYGVDIGYGVDGTNKSKYAYVAKQLGDEIDEELEKGFIGRKSLSLQHNRLLSLYTNLDDEVGQPLYTFSGGPHSLYGIGRTTIRKYYKSRVAKPNIGTSPKHRSDGESSVSFNVQNFLKGRNAVGTSKYSKQGSGSMHREIRYGLGNPGINQRLQPYNISDDKSVDQINALKILRSKVEIPKEFKHNGKTIADFIPFRFEAVNADDPTEADFMIFRAYLDSYSDNFKGNWNKFNYNGRAENFYTYNNFDRKISFAFKIGAQSRAEMQPLYTKLNYLISNVSPEYKNTRLRGAFIRLTIGDLVHRTPGFITSLNLKWKNGLPWEIVADPAEKDKNQYQLPQVLDVSCQFTPVHNFIPQKSTTKSPFILPHKFNGTVNSEWLAGGVVENYSEPNEEENQEYTFTVSDSSVNSEVVNNNDDNVNNDQEIVSREQQAQWQLEKQIQNWKDSGRTEQQRGDKIIDRTKFRFDGVTPIDNQTITDNDYGISVEFKRDLTVEEWKRENPGKNLDGGNPFL
tara:strand:+ start:4785 stop:7034 length:2250 start_codon:yes stop_codon:yes gene_type:complete